MNKIEKMYYRLPTFLQNIAVTLKGAQIHWIRTRGSYSKFKQEVSDRSNWSKAQFDAFQLQKLNALLVIARKNNAYLRDKYRSVPDKLTSLDELRLIPTLSKNEIKANAAAFAEFSKDKAHFKIKTTGSTGTPLEVFSDATARQLNYAFFDHFLEQSGVSARDKHIVIGGRQIIDVDQAKPPFWRHSRVQNSLLMSSYHLNSANVGFFLDAIEKFQPTYIDAYPSALSYIANYALSHNHFLNIPAVFTSSETLLPHQREAIERAFNTQIFDQYGCVEMTLFVGQCRQGRYHVRPDYGLLEIVDDAGNPLGLQEVGNIVCTGFVNDVFPLIRYEMGDRGSFGQPCSCGSKTPTLATIEGRVDDIIVTQSGARIGRLSPILKGQPILEAQYIQHKIGHVKLVIVPADNFIQGTSDKLIIDKVKSYLGKDMEVDITLTDKIARGKGGKFRAVISNIAP